MSKQVGEKCGKLCISSNLSSKRDITPTKIDAKKSGRAPQGIVKVCGGNGKIFEMSVKGHGQSHAFKIYGTIGKALS